MVFFSINQFIKEIEMNIMALTVSPVVQNVALNAAAESELQKPSVTADTASNELKKLESKRINWEATVYRTSNQQLYSLLADCLEYGRPMEVAEAKIRNKELVTFFEERGYAVKAESPLFNRIAKAVFGNIDRRRISTYSLVLRSAQRSGVNAANLAEWIEQRGGIQEIKLTRSATYVSPKAKAEHAKTKLSSMANLAVAKEELAKLADAEFIGSKCVLLAEQQADGSFHIKSMTRSATAVNAALSALYAEQAKAAA
jgi:hypothetical protein